MKKLLVPFLAIAAALLTAGCSSNGTPLIRRTTPSGAPATPEPTSIHVEPNEPTPAPQ